MVSDLPGPAQLQMLRRSMQCSQERLAELSGVSVRAIRKIESGLVARPHRATLDRLAGGLGLGGAEAEQFVAVWHPTDALQTRTVDDIIARQSRIRDHLSPAAQSARNRQLLVLHARHDVVGEQYSVERSTATMVVRAAEDGLDRAVLVNHDDSAEGADDFELVDLDNCEIVSVVTVPELAVRIVELDLGVRLLRGQMHRYGFTRLRPGGSGERVRRAGVGVMSGGQVVAQQVSFAAGVLPASLRHTWSSSAAGPEYTVEHLQLSRFGSAGFTAPNPVPGLHQIVWDWPE